jgi:hypothetical protein
MKLIQTRINENTVNLTIKQEINGKVTTDKIDNINHRAKVKKLILTASTQTIKNLLEQRYGL